MKKINEEKLKEIKGGFMIGVSPFVNLYLKEKSAKKVKFTWRKFFGI